jgi:hypothetical protein
MSKPNNDLVSTKIKKSSKQRLEVIKAFEGATSLGRADYAMLEVLIDVKYAEVMSQLAQTGY